MPPAVNRGMIYLHEDPERGWAELGEYIVWEAVTYGRWSDDPSRSSMHLPGVQTLEQVRESGRYRFLTPDEARAFVASLSRSEKSFFSALTCSAMPQRSNSLASATPLGPVE